MTLTNEPPPPGGPAAVATPAPVDVPDGPTWWGVRTVATLEARQRLRSTRWKVALTVWVAVVALVTLGVHFAVGDYGGDHAAAGNVIFGLVALFVLFVGLVVAPPLSATTINGDRATGTLALLQATTLSAWDIALGKLLAAWLAALAFLAASVPFLAWGVALGGAALWQGIVAVLVLAFLLLVVCAVGLAMSALVSRTSGSAVLTYTAVAALSVGTVIAFGLTASLAASGWEEVEVYGYHGQADGWDPTTSACTWQTEERWVTHTDTTAWLLAGNPFVVLADAAAPAGTGMGEGPLELMSWSVRSAFSPGWAQVDECWNENREPAARQPGAPVWPWGLGFYALLGAGSLWFSAHRLAVPVHTLPRGTRIA